MKSIEFIESIIEFSFFFCMVVWLLLLVPIPFYPSFPLCYRSDMTQSSGFGWYWHCYQTGGCLGYPCASQAYADSQSTLPLGLDRNAQSVQTPYLPGAGTSCTQLQNGRWCWSPHRSAKTRTFWPWHFGCSYRVCFECLSPKIARTPKKVIRNWNL